MVSEVGYLRELFYIIFKAGILVQRGSDHAVCLPLRSVFLHVRSVGFRFRSVGVRFGYDKGLWSFYFGSSFKIHGWGRLDTRQLASDYKKLQTAAAVIALWRVVTGT